MTDGMSDAEFLRSIAHAAEVDDPLEERHVTRLREIADRVAAHEAAAQVGWIDDSRSALVARDALGRCPVGSAGVRVTDGCNVKRGCPLGPRGLSGWRLVRYVIRHPWRSYDHLFVHGYWT